VDSGAQARNKHKLNKINWEVLCMRIVEPVYPVSGIHDEEHRKPVSIRDNKDFKKYLEEAVEKLKQKNKRSSNGNGRFALSRLDVTI